MTMERLSPPDLTQAGDGDTEVRSQEIERDSSLEEGRKVEVVSEPSAELLSDKARPPHDQAVGTAMLQASMPAKDSLLDAQDDGETEQQTSGRREGLTSVAAGRPGADDRPDAGGSEDRQLP